MSRSEYMAGVVLTRHGGPEVLEWREDIPIPALAPGDALVRVLAAGVNNTDINTRTGWYSPAVTGATAEVDQAKAGEGWSGSLTFPRIQGADLCGRVVDVGEGVSPSLIGQRVTCPIELPRPTPGNPNKFIVLGSEIDGAFAQYCRVRADELHDVTASPLSDTEIAAIPCAFGTAELLLTRAGVAAGQGVLITGASGGVGMAAVQLARLRGAHVTAVTAPAKAAAVRDAGAEQVLERGAEPPAGHFDVVVDVVGGAGWMALIRSLKPGGVCAVSGAIAGPLVQIDLRDIYLNDITIHGCTYQPPAIFERLVDLINTGQIRPLVSQTYALRDIATAQADFMAKRYPGKIVLIPPGDE